MADDGVSDSGRASGWLCTQFPPKANVKRNSRINQTQRPILRQTHLQTKTRKSLAKLDDIQPSSTATKQSSLLKYVARTDLTCDKVSLRLSQSDWKDSGDQNIVEKNKCNVFTTNTDEPTNKRQRTSLCDIKCRKDSFVCEEDMESPTTSILTEHGVNIPTCGNDNDSLVHRRKINSQDEIKDERVSASLDSCSFSSLEVTAPYLHTDGKENVVTRTRRTLSLKSSCSLYSDRPQQTYDMLEYDHIQSPVLDGKTLFIESEENITLSCIGLSKSPGNSGTPDLTLKEYTDTGCDELQGEKLALTSGPDSNTLDFKDDKDLFSCWSEDFTSKSKDCSLRDSEKHAKEKYKKLMGTLAFSDVDSFSFQ